MQTERFIRTLLFVATACVAFAARDLHAQSKSKTESQRIEEQRRVIAELEREIAAEEKRLSGIKRDKSSAQQRVQSITRQIDSRNRLLSQTEREISDIRSNISHNDSLLATTRNDLVTERERYAEMVREAYRNYRQNSYATYLGPRLHRRRATHIEHPRRGRPARR